MKSLTTYIAASAIAASLIGTAGYAFAQTTTPATPPAATDAGKGSHHGNHWDPKAHHAELIDHLFAKYDPQKTGVITIESYLKDVDARFDKVDTKKQGYIDQAELTAYFGTSKPQAVELAMKRLDAKGDGKITKDEFEKPARKRFALFDLKDEGKITREEVEIAGPLIHILLPWHEHGQQGRGDWQHRHGPENKQPAAQ